MINEFFLPQLDELGLENMWFQQDGATAHTARATTDMLNIGSLLLRHLVLMPSDEEQMKQVAIQIYQIARFPRIIGAIDCTHVRIKSPGGDYAEIYRNRKSYFPINTQATCSADLMYNDVLTR